MLAGAILSGFLLALFAPWIARRTGPRAGLWLGALPALLTLYFLSWLPGIGAGGAAVLDYPWLPGLGIRFSFLVDGLSLLFALLISFIGALVFVFAGAYMEGHRDLARLYALLLAFMASMLGLVLADNLITLFVFWELTSITSYLLIGFDHENAAARKAALQGLFITAGGGLALLAGFILLAQAGGSYSLAELLQRGEVVRAHGDYLPLLALILLGAFTKSAQFPFHFWLPNAMAAPTPVSTYLHSATMVKAGIYLLARLTPVLGGTEAWSGIVAGIGAVTMLVGAVLAVRNTALKRILAYSTVMALGTMTMLMGLGTEAALAAALVFLFAHSLYKGALFLVAGVIDHQTGGKDLTTLGGLRQALPVTATVAALAALSLAGVIPLLGFIAKEALIEATLAAPFAREVLFAVVVLTAALTATVAGLVGLSPFFGARVVTPRVPREGGALLLAGPAALAGLGLLFGLLPGLLATPLLAPALAAVLGAPAGLHLVLWHGFTPAWAASVSALFLGLAGYWYRDRLRGALGRLDGLFRLGPEAGYERFMAGLVWVATRQTRLLQNGYLRNYVLSIVLSTLVLVGWTLVSRDVELPRLPLDILLHEVVIAMVILTAATYAASTSSSLGAVAALGTVGFGIALIYVLFSAPDLGMTQVLVETLTVVLLVLVLYRLPGFARLSSRAQRIRDVLVAFGAGCMITWLILLAAGIQWEPSISGFFVQNSQTLAHGRNIVNVILVDFRALDTLGEIYVLALAALGVYAMVKLRRREP